VDVGVLSVVVVLELLDELDDVVLVVDMLELEDDDEVAALEELVQDDVGTWSEVQEDAEDVGCQADVGSVCTDVHEDVAGTTEEGTEIMITDPRSLDFDRLRWSSWNQSGRRRRNSLTRLPTSLESEFTALDAKDVLWKAAKATAIKVKVFFISSGTCLSPPNPSQFILLYSILFKELVSIPFKQSHFFLLLCYSS
jgi:hypothetical protein